MKSISLIDVYELLSQKLGKAEARILADFIEAKSEKNIDKESNHLAINKDL